MPYFFVAGREGERVWLTPADARHLAGPLRARIGEVVEMIDAERAELLAVRLTAVDRSGVEGIVTESSEHAPEPAASVWMGLAMLPAAALEETLARCTELGAAGFHLVMADRSVGRSARPERWAAVCREAAMLAGRLVIPPVIAAQRIEGVLEAAAAGDETVVLLDRSAERRLADVAAERSGARRALLLVGPEGGWSGRERETAVAAGARPAALGPRNLRAGNAAAAALAIWLAGR